MIVFETNKGDINFVPGAKVGLVFNNPILEQDFEAKNYSLGVDVPATAPNLLIIGQGNIIESAERPNSIAGRLKYKGVILNKGTMVLKGFTDKSFRFNIEIDNDNINFGSVDVGTIVNEVINFANVDAMLLQFKTDVNKYWPDVKYCLPMLHVKDFYNGNNETFGEGYGWEYLNKTDGGNSTTFEFVQNFYDAGSDTNKNVNAIVPFFFTKYILKTIVESLGFEIGGDWWADKLVDTQFIYNNFPLDKLTTATYDIGTFLDVETFFDFDIPNPDNPLGTGTELRVPLEFVNDNTLDSYDVEEFQTTIDRVGDYTFDYIVKYFFEVGIHLPSTANCRASVFLDGDLNGVVTEIPNSRSTFSQSGVDATERTLSKNVSFTVTEEQVGMVVSLKIVFSNASILNVSSGGRLGVIRSDTTRLTASLNNVPENLNTFLNQISVGKHMPDMSCNDFVAEYCKQFGLYWNLDKKNNILEFNYLKNYTKNAEEVDWTNKVLKGYSSTVEPIKTRGWKYDFAGDTFLERSGAISKSWFTLNYENSQSKLLFKFCPVLQSNQNWFDSLNNLQVTTPRIEGEVGASPLFGLGGQKNTAAPRLLYYWGMRKFSPVGYIDNLYYNYASGDYSRRPNSLGYMGNALVNSDGSDSAELLLKRHHREWNSFVDSMQPFDFEVLLDVNDLNQIQTIMKKKIRIKNSLYILKDVKVNAGDEIEVANCLLYKL